MLPNFGLVGWNGPDSFFERPISGQFLSRQANSGSATTKSTRMCAMSINYQVTGSRAGKFRIFTEAQDYAANSPSTINFRSPLVQELSISGNNNALPATMDVSVIYYDYKSYSEGSWWSASGFEFNAPMGDYQDGVIKNMVKDTLTNFTTFDSKYFDHVTFKLDQTQGPGTYIFSRLGNVKTNPNHHNFSFCMEMHTTFQYQSGLIFEFTGDDDTWAFINNKQVIDLGGLHYAASQYLNVDDVPGLVMGKSYPLDFFQCERHTSNSASRIVTNMVKPKGGGIREEAGDAIMEA